MSSSGFRLKLFFFLFLSVMVLGTVVFAHFEELSFLDALYFSIVTVATVGYGDIHPTTASGKILAIALIITGVGTFLEVIAGITQVMLRRRENEVRSQKLNMILGLFFSEIGTGLLGVLSKADTDLSPLVERFSTIADWESQRYADEAKRVSEHLFKVDADKADFPGMRRFLGEKSDFMLRLLENPAILEHESFTELLRSIFHFRDELLHRDDLSTLPGPDKNHLAGDIERIYRQLTVHWLLYMKYLRFNYQYLFSLANRTNPFNSAASATISE